eukprot:CAMPEP_0114554692 /NCGR_PEP_ID=MMETSP0114-20121206/8347_1 /TAXON_ID=31324 /ORGANISM="Goniomonas sp, Strain m" /LENGTH=238 /DNA_ID=CAMNT_0001739759 /DNA_START=177 /DNA_END=893 /DNA_ORIENTATION=-
MSELNTVDGEWHISALFGEAKGKGGFSFKSLDRFKVPVKEIKKPEAPPPPKVVKLTRAEKAAAKLAALKPPEPPPPPPPKPEPIFREPPPPPQPKAPDNELGLKHVHKVGHVCLACVAGKIGGVQKVVSIIRAFKTQQEAAGVTFPEIPNPSAGTSQIGTVPQHGQSLAMLGLPMISEMSQEQFRSLEKQVAQPNAPNVQPAEPTAVQPAPPNRIVPAPALQGPDSGTQPPSVPEQER